MITIVQRFCVGTLLAIFTLIWSGPAAGQSMDFADSWLPLLGVEFADNGDLVDWRVENLTSGPSDLIEPQHGLLAVRAFLADKDISDQVTWRRLPDKPGFLGRFIGTNADRSLEIHRDYRSGASPGEIMHYVQAASSVDDISLVLRLAPNLIRHSANDRSLGHVFYGYNRVFAGSQDTDGSFEPVRQQRHAVSAAIVARHVAVVVTPTSGGGNALTVDPETGISIRLNRTRLQSTHRLALGALKLDGTKLGSGPFRTFLYSDMWHPLRHLAKGIERLLNFLTTTIGNSGAAIIVFAILVRLILMPLGLWSARQQRQFSSTQEMMKPEIKRIEKNFSGAEKSEKLLQAYKEHGLSPFSGLKSSIALFVQIPILITVFAVTTESTLFRDAPFLWSSDLSLPDKAFSLPFSLPGLGASVNLLPIILGTISVFSALVQARSYGSSASGSSRPGLILALVFVVFFYSCAAALVLYWIAINISQFFESILANRSTSRVLSD